MKYYKLTATILLLLILVSCSSDFLVESPESSISTQDFFKSAGDAETALNSIYGSLQDQFSDFQLTLATTDDGFSASGAGNAQVQSMWRYTFDATNDRVFSTFWGSQYKIINYTNLSIDRIPSIDMDENLKNNYIGEARFLRAFSYFKLVRFWGEIPLITMPTETVEGVKVTKSSVEAVYNQIIEDLTFASINLFEKGATVKGRASKEAAQALLAEVYLTLGDWQMAQQQTKAIINSGNFNLVPNFKDLFTASTESNEEIIMAYQYSAMDGFGYPSKTYLPKDKIPGWRGLNAFAPTQDLWDSYEANDLRRDVTMFTTFKEANGNIIQIGAPWFRKFWDMETDNTDNAGIDVPISRYADVLLMHAEASNEASGPSAEAINMVNMVRRRGYGLNINTVSSIDLPSGISQDNFRVAIWKERRWELAGEYHRWFDLKRTNRLASVVGAWLNSVPGTSPFDPSKHLLFPIPETELDANPNLTQNPGW